MRTIEDYIVAMIKCLKELSNFHRNSRYDIDYNNGMADAYDITSEQLQDILFRYTEESEVEE